jgi:hypothetical protein
MDRLHEDSVNTRPQSLGKCIAICMSCQEQEWRVTSQRQLMKFANELPTVHSWHADIAHDQVWRIFKDSQSRFMTVSARDYTKVLGFEDSPEALAKVRFVVDDQDRVHWR